MSHEESITVELDGKFYNLPTKHKGKKLSTDEAVEAFRKGVTKQLGGTHSNLNRALRAARSRSQRTDPKTHKIKPKRRGIDRRF